MNSNSDSDTDTDSDDYIDLSTCVENNLKHMFQFHLINEKLLIKHIGKSSDTPDIIIMENFGPELNMSLYNCVYSHDELESIKNTKLSVINEEEEEEEEVGEAEAEEAGEGEAESFISLDENNLDNLEYLKLFFPIIKLIVKNDSDNYTITSIAIKLCQEIVYEKEIEQWELYWIENSSSNKEYIKTKKIEKNINPSNILENLVKLSLNL